jgi:hypothetical protein
MLGDWDPQSTPPQADGPARRDACLGRRCRALLAQRPDDLAGFERRLLVATRGERASGEPLLLPIVEELATGG